MCHLGPPGNSCKDRIISIRDLVGGGGWLMFEKR